MTNEKKIENHYSQGKILNTILDAFKKTKKPIENLKAEDFAPVDEFHVGGLEATHYFIKKLSIKNNYKVLDIGCGLGGPARYAADKYECRVKGVDLTREYIDVGNKISNLVGLKEVVSLYHGSALSLPFGNSIFDAAYMIHVGMNIKDKQRLTNETFRVLKPGAFFGIYDVMKINSDILSYPVPWAENKDTSSVDTPDYYKSCLTKSGFIIINEENRKKFAIEFFEKSIKKTSSDNDLSPLGTHILMGKNAKKKFENSYRNIKTNLVSPYIIIAFKE